VVFPSGPPAPGIALQVADVTLDSDPTDPGELVVRLTNTGGRPAAAVLDVLVPAGVDITRLPAECQSRSELNPTTTECGLGTIGPGVQRAIGVRLTVSDVIRADSPLAGLVRASLTPSGQPARRTQASYQIIAPPAQAGVNVATTASTAPSSRGATPALDNPAAMAIILGSILMLALVGVGLVLLLDLRPTVGRGRGRPWSARTGPWRPVATFAPPITATGSPVAAAAATTTERPEEPDDAETDDPPAGMVAAGVAPDRPRGQDWQVRPRGQEGQDRPNPAETDSGGPETISLVWTEVPDSTPPPGRPVG